MYKPDRPPAIFSRKLARKLLVLSYSSILCLLIGTFLLLLHNDWFALFWIAGLLLLMIHLLLLFGYYRCPHCGTWLGKQNKANHSHWQERALKWKGYDIGFCPYCDTYIIYDDSPLDPPSK